MTNDFYIDEVGSGTFGARLLSTYKIGGTPIKRTRQKQPGVQGWLPLKTEYGLRPITLPVHVQGGSPLDATEKLSQLIKALSKDPVDIRLPNGMMYFASLDSVGDATEVTQDGCLLASTIKLCGYAHGGKRTLTADIRDSPRALISVYGTAPAMACRIIGQVVSVARPPISSETTGTTLFAGITLRNVKYGDTVIIDGFSKKLLVNGANRLADSDLVEWPTLMPGDNIIQSLNTVSIEYYPIWI